MKHCKKYRGQEERNVKRRPLKEIELLEYQTHGHYEGLGKEIKYHCELAFLAHKKYRKQSSYEHCKEHRREDKVNEIDREYQKEFQKIINDYALKENGQLVYSDDLTSIRIIPGKEEECTKKITELRELEVSLDDFKFDIDEFENLNLTISQMSAILPFIKE